MRKDIKKKGNTWSTCMSFIKNIKYQLPSNEKKIIKVVSTVLWKEVQIKLFGKLNKINITGVPYLLVGNGTYVKWLVVWKCQSTETKEIIVFYTGMGSGKK